MSEATEEVTLTVKLNGGTVEVLAVKVPNADSGGDYHLVNLTPHVLNVQGGRWGETVIPQSGIVARCTETVTPSTEYMDSAIPVNISRFGEVTGLPEPRFTVLYIVSMPVQQAANRVDVLRPGSPVRDAEGKIVGANGLFAVDAPAPRSMMLSYLEQEMSEAIHFANPAAKIEYQQGGGYVLSV